MRLGQMARRLGVSQSEIVRYLASLNTAVEESVNTKLNPGEVRALYERFAPQWLTENHDESEPATLPPDVQAVAANQVSANVDGAENSAPEAGEMPEAAGETGRREGEHGGVIPSPGDVQPSPDLIRAPKVELSGLRVLGKIELPEPKKKEELKPEEIREDEESAAQPPRDRREPRDKRRNQDGDRSKRNKRREPRAYQNPVAKQREQELQSELEKRKEKAAKEKERRTQNYHNRVKLSPPTKSARLVKEPVEELTAGAEEAKPTSWFGRILRWFGA